ncbi:hypothetical protein EMIT0232MI5_40010 [Pseudomonas sp. IT-232MI5]
MSFSGWKIQVHLLIQQTGTVLFNHHLNQYNFTQVYLHLCLSQAQHDLPPSPVKGIGP